MPTRKTLQFSHFQNLAHILNFRNRIFTQAPLNVRLRPGETDHSEWRFRCKHQKILKALNKDHRDLRIFSQPSQDPKYFIICLLTTTVAHLLSPHSNSDLYLSLNFHPKFLRLYLVPLCLARISKHSPQTLLSQLGILPVLLREPHWRL